MVFELMKHYITAKLDGKFQTLEDEVEHLKEKKDWLLQCVDEAHSNGKEIHGNAIEWLSLADKAIGDAKDLLQQREEATLKPSWNLTTLYQLSKAAEITSSTVNHLGNEQGFHPVSISQQATEPCSALPSRVLVSKLILDSLRDPDLNLIGVYGVGGVGKTALLEAVRAQVMQEKLFTIVVMVSITRSPCVRRIQAEIADVSGLKFYTDDISLRAALLSERLNKSKALIILDDLWRKLDLKEVGVPLSCKVLLCSRKKEVFSCEMRTHKEFKLDVLEEEEALDLFQAALPSVKNVKLQTLGTQIAKSCSGLPFLLQIVAQLLQNKNPQIIEPNAWDYMLKQLSAFPSDEERVHNVIESIFESLPGEEEKSLFLLCALFGGSHIPMEHLLICSAGLDLLADTDTIEAARRRLIALIKELEKHHLLERSLHNGYAKIPGMVNDVAISMASKLQHVFIGAGPERLRDLPSNNCTRISLQYCDAMEFSSGLHCPMVELFSLSTENPCLQIPDLFFEGITGLKVVSVTGMCFGSRLPSSLGFLTSLHSLCLNGCRMNDVAVVTKLKQLQILSLADSSIVGLPRKLGGLTNLKLLNLRNCSDLKVIPADVISKLCSLEELYIFNSFVGWDTRGYARLSELPELDRLSTLELQILDPKLIPKNLKFFSKLKNYRISIGDGWIGDEKYETSRILNIKLEAGIEFEGGIKALLKSTQELHINTMMGIKCVLYQGLPELKHLHIGYDDGIQHLLNSIAKTAHHGFPVLESLYVYNFDRQDKAYEGEDEEIIITEVREKAVLYLDGKGFPQLKHLHIRNNNTIPPSIKQTDQAFRRANQVLESLYLINFNSLEWVLFWKLRSVTVINCCKMMVVFTFSRSKCLPKLQELEVAECESIEAIVDDDGRYSNEVFNGFTQLSSLKLRKLPYLRAFCKREAGTSQIKPLFEMVLFPNLTTLEIAECNSLQYIFTTETVQCLPLLEKLEINNCGSVEEIILNDGVKEKNINETVFPRLEFLSLCGLQNLRRFANKFRIVFLSLKELFMQECPAMDNFVSDFSANENCDYFFSEMVIFSNLETMTLRNMNAFKFLWLDQLVVDGSFFKLTSLSIAHCSQLSVVFPSNIFRRFQKLESLYVSSCGKVEEIFQYEGVDFEGRNDVQASCIRSLQMVNLPSLKYVLSEFMARHVLTKLEEVEVHDCDIEVIILKRRDAISGATSSFTSPHLSLLQPDSTCQPSLKPEGMYSHSEEEVPIDFPQLRVLKLKNLLYLSGFCNKIEQGFGKLVHFPKLTSLELNKCNRLKYVFSTSLVKSLMQLRKIEIVRCELLEEIFLSMQPGEIHKIVLPELDFLSLVKLPHMRMFSCGCPVEFPSLTILFISYCSMLNNFVPKYISNNTTEYLFNDMVSFPKLEKLEVGNTNIQKYLWEGRFRDDDSFSNLKSLKIEYCLNLLVVFPPNVYRRFHRLETLAVSCCPRVEDIYHCEEMNIAEIFELQDIEIWNLPSLRNIWSKESYRASSFQHLQSVKVDSCRDLVHVFPMSIACALLQLQLLKIANSDVEVIIGKEDYDFETEGIPRFAFPQLSTIQLENLMQLSSLYEGTYTLKCPKLKSVEIHGCDKMTTLYSEISAYHQNSESKYLQLCNYDQVIETPPSFGFRVFQNVAELTLDHQGLKEIQSADVPVKFSKLKKVTLRCLEADSIPLLLGFIRSNSLDKLVIEESFLEDIFPLDNEDEQSSARVKMLEVVGDDNLNHILKKCSLANPILQNIDTLIVKYCDCLINVAPSSASFRNLTILSVSLCCKMENLVTASTAKTMVNLTKLRVSECPMMEEIVAEDRNLENEGRLMFNKMKQLELNDLPRLNGFCSSQYAFDFPALEQVVVNNCFRMKTFCGGPSNTPKLKGVELNDEQTEEINLNNQIEHMKKQERGNLTLPTSSHSVFKIVVMRVLLCCLGCAHQIKKLLLRMEGVKSVSIELEINRVIVIGDVSPVQVLESISKFKAAEFWSPPYSLSK